MASDKDAHFIDKFKPDAYVKEGLRSGEQFLPTKSALQFYALGRGVSEQRAKEASVKIKQLELKGYRVDIPDNGSVEGLLSMVEAMLKMRNLRKMGYQLHIPRKGDINIMAEYAMNLQQKLVSEQAVQVFLSLKVDEKNFSNKASIELMTRKIFDDNMMLAGAISEKVTTEGVNRRKDTD
jgi:hypothetical protein